MYQRPCRPTHYCPLQGTTNCVLGTLNSCARFCPLQSVFETWSLLVGVTLKEGLQVPKNEVTRPVSRLRKRVIHLQPAEETAFVRPLCPVFRLSPYRLFGALKRSSPHVMGPRSLKCGQFGYGTLIYEEPLVPKALILIYGLHCKT